MHLDPEIQQALDALPADFRAAVVLCDLEELSYEEIAATLGIKVGTVRSRIHRGRVLLREALAHRAPGVRPVEPGTEPVPVAPFTGAADRP
jgi:RNA polymerase sigma-70 factor (ECF subfamily)